MLDMHIRPSEIMGITNTYLAFCFDEACAYIIKEMQDGKEPVFKIDNDIKKEAGKKVKPSDIYSKFNKK